MGKHHKLIAPAATAPLSRTTDSGRSTVRLPTEMVSEQMRRVAVFSTVGVVLWTFALMLEAFVVPALLTGGQRNWRAITIQLFGSIGSAVMWIYLRRPEAEAEHKNNIGLGMMLFH